MRALALCLLVFLAACASQGQLPAPQFNGPHPLDGTIHDLRTGERINAETLAERLADADIVILGETHDNAQHHLAQAWLVGQLRPAGIAFEMIPQDQEPAIAAHLAAGGTPGTIGKAIGWAKTGWPDWELYRPIFTAWRPETYKGGAVSRQMLQAHGMDGVTALIRNPRLRAMLAQPLAPATRAAIEDEMIAAHCNMLPREAAAAMVGVQRLRDASFADAVLRAHQAGSPAVLITGAGHARVDRGVPAYLRAAAPELEVLSLGMVETDPARMAVADYGLPHDFAWFTPPAERPDPCAAFRKKN